MINYIISHDWWRRCQRPWWWWMMMDDDGWRWIWMRTVLFSVSVKVLLVVAGQSEWSWHTKAKNDSRRSFFFGGENWGYVPKKMCRWSRLVWYQQKGTKIHASSLEKVPDMLLPMLNPWKGRNCWRHSFMAREPHQWRWIDVMILLGTWNYMFGRRW